MDSTKALFLWYQEKYNDYSITYDESKVDWDMQQLLPIPKSEVNKFFNEEGFFKNLKPYEKAIDILNKLSKEYTLELVSLHNKDGMKLKYDFIKRNLPMFEIVNLYPLGEKFDKSMCTCNVAIDDRLDCLESINAKHKLLYGNYSWNTDSNKYYRATNWDEVYDYISKIKE